MKLWKPIIGITAVLSVALAMNAAVSLAQHGGGSEAPKAAEPAKKAAPAGGPRCPLTGEPADLSVSVAADDGPVFFCCSNCTSKYEADAAKYATAVAAQRKALEALPKVQVLCPVMKKPVDEQQFIEEGGGKVYFCCNGCPTRYRKDPAKFKAGLANSYTYQTKCPVEGTKINAKFSRKLESGQTIYFGSDESAKAFLAEPAKYVANLASQGIKVDPAKAKEAKKG